MKVKICYERVRELELPDEMFGELPEDKSDYISPYFLKPACIDILSNEIIRLEDKDGKVIYET